VDAMRASIKRAVEHSCVLFPCEVSGGHLDYEFVVTESGRPALVSIRREFARAGFTVDQFPDSQIEAALTRWNDDITAVILSAKTIYRALKQLGHVTRDQRTPHSGDEDFREVNKTG
jgi:hypothetical protein